MIGYREPKRPFHFALVTKEEREANFYRGKRPGRMLHSCDFIKSLSGNTVLELNIDN